MEKTRFLHLKQPSKEEPLSIIHKGRILELSTLLKTPFEDEEDFLDWSLEHLPHVILTERAPSACVTIITSTRPSHKIETFLMDLVRARVLSDGVQLSSLDYTPFSLETMTDRNFLIAKFHLVVERKADLDKIRQAALQIQREIALYLSSTLFLKPGALPNDEFQFYEAIAKLLHRSPERFEKDFIQDYYHFLGIVPKEFKNHRSLRHQVRLLACLYLMRKKVMYKLPFLPNEPHLEMHLIPNKLHFPFGQKAVIGIAIVINLPNPYERFDSHHIVMAAQRLIPWVQLIRESFLSFQKPGSSLQSFYLEIEKKDNTPFTSTEIGLLKQSLRSELAKSVEVLKPSIFGLCDLEESMRNTFLLSQELQTSKDLPQVMISFEGASDKSLIFRVIMVRLLAKQSKPLHSYFQALDEPLEYIPERNTAISYIGKYKKEASIFRLQLPKEPFLYRSDSSLNLYRARQHICELMKKAFGEIRDYNGGIFSKQLELFSKFKQLFETENSELLEDFFHSINPPEMQAILSLDDLSRLFQLFLKTQKTEPVNESNYILETQTHDSSLFAIIRIKDSAFQEKINQALTQEGLFQEITVRLAMKHSNEYVLGYIYQTFSGDHELFSRVLHKALEEWAAEKQSSQVFRFEMHDLPVSLDPRLGGDEISGIVLKMLFEGLMRIGKDGKPGFASAHNVLISENGTKYTFKLRSSFWNNGDPVTSHDFCYAWKKVLSPHFSTVFAYLFYDIKNAKKAKEGKVSVDEVGVYPIDDSTLVVELERPCSYFLELVCNPLYSPVNHRIDNLYPNWSLQTGKDYVCNGPFYLETVNSGEAFLMKKNPTYWDARSVKLDHIHVIKATAKKAFELFEKGEIDWLGRPTSPWEPFFYKSIKQPIKKLSSSHICWCSCNVQYKLLKSRTLRLALSYAIDRQAIVNEYANDRVAAFSPLPYIHTQYRKTITQKERQKAKQLFEKALQELGMRKEEFPSLTLIHTNNDVRNKMAATLAQQWKEVLGITIQAQGYDFRDLFTKITQGDYQLAMTMWRTWVDDPLYTLNTFRKANETVNLSKWENKKYQRLLDQYYDVTDDEQKEKLLLAAESILIKEVPVIPIYYETDLCAYNEYIDGVLVSKIGNIDFKYVSIKKNVLRRESYNLKG